MTGSILQLYYKYKFNINLKSDNIITFFNLVYLQYINFSIDNIILYSEDTNNFGTENTIKLLNTGDFINNLIFKIDLFSLDTYYKYNSLRYINILKKEKNLHILHDNNMMYLNIYKLNVIIKNISSTTNNIKYPYYISDKNINVFNPYFYNSNKYLTKSYELDESIFLSLSDLNKNILNFDNFNNIINDLTNVDINNKIILKDFKLTNNDNTNNNNIFDNILNLHFNIYENYCDSFLKYILLALKKIFYNILYIKINTYSDILYSININIENKLLHKNDLDNNTQVYNYLYNRNFNKINQLDFYINKINLSIVLKFDSINNFLDIESSNIFIIKKSIQIDNLDIYIDTIYFLEHSPLYYDSLHIYPVDKPAYVQLYLKLFTNNLDVLNEDNITIYKNQSTNISITISKSKITNTNIYNKQYTILLPILNELSLSLSDIKNFLFIYDNNALKIIFIIDNIIFFNNDILVYCSLYNDTLSLQYTDNLYLYYKTEPHYLYNSKDLNISKIFALKNDYTDTYKTYEYINNYDSQYLLNLSSIDYKEFILLSLENTMRYNYILLKNIVKNLYTNINIVYGRIDYDNFEDDVLKKNDNKYIFFGNNKNIDIISYFINKFKNSFLTYNNIILKNSLTTYIVPYIDIINNEIQDYYYEMITNFSEHLNIIYEKNKDIYEDLIKKIYYISQQTLQLKILAGSIIINANDTLYLFKDKNEQYLTKLTLVSKTLYDLDEDRYIYLCDLIDENLEGIYSNYYISNTEDCSQYSIIINITSDLLDLTNFNNYKNYKLTSLDEYKVDDSSNIYFNQKKYCITYYILIYLIHLYNIIKVDKVVSASGVIINNNIYNDLIFKKIIELYYKVYNIIKKYEYSDTENNLNNIKLYDNYQFNEFASGVWIEKKYQIIIYNIINYNFFHKPSTILYEIFNMFESNYNYFISFLDGKKIKLSNNDISQTLSIQYLMEKIPSELENIYNIYINNQLETNYFDIYHVMNIFEEDYIDYSNFLDNLFDIEEVVGSDIKYLIDYYKDNFGALDYEVETRVRTLTKNKINKHINGLNDDKLTDFKYKTEYLAYIDTQISLMTSNFNYYFENINLMNIKKLELNYDRRESILKKTDIYFEYNDPDYDKYQDIIYNTTTLDTFIQNDLIDTTGDYHKRYAHKDTTILYNNDNGVIDNLFINLKNNEYDLTQVKTKILDSDTGLIYNYNLLLLVGIIDKSLFTNSHKEYLTLRNNIYNIIITNLDQIIGSNTNIDLINKLLQTYYTDNILPYLTNKELYGLQPNFVEINNNNYIIFNEEFYLDNNNEFIKLSLTQIKEILTNITTYKLKTIDFTNFSLIGNIVLKEIEEVKINISNIFYDYKKTNLTIEDDFYSKINDLLKTNYTVDSIQKYYLYKNCILTYSEYTTIIPKDKFAVLKITNVDEDGKIITYNISTNSSNYTDNQQFCLSYSNGINAYGTIVLDTDGTIKNLIFTSYGQNFIVNELVLIESYDLPENLEFIDTSFKYIRRKTDLPFELYYDYSNDTLTRRFSNKYFIILQQILFNLNYLLSYDYSHTFDITSFLYSSDTIISFSQSLSTFKKYDSITKTYIDKYYTIVELSNSNNYNFNFIKIENSSYYDDIYILYPTTETNKYEIKTEYISSDTGIYSTGLKVIYSDSRLNKLINYMNLDFYLSNNNLSQTINLIEKKLDFTNSIKIKYDNITTIYDIINELSLNIINNIYEFNRIKIYSSNFADSYKVFPLIDDSNHHSLKYKVNNLDIKNLIDIKNKFKNISKETDRIVEECSNMISTINININKYLLIKDEIDSLVLNPYNKGDKSKSSWIKNLGLNIFENCSLYFNDKLINNIPREYFCIDFEINTTKNNKEKYNKLIGNISDLTNYDSEAKKEYTLYVKIPFWFCNYKKQFLHINKLNNSNITLKYKINKLENLVIMENNSVILNKDKFNTSLIVDYIYMDNKYSNIIKRDEYLIEEIQYLISRNLNYQKTYIDIPLQFKNCIKDMIFVLIKHNDIINKNYNKYEYINILNENDNPIKESYITINEKKITIPYNDIYLNYINSYKYYNSTPKLGVNIYSFSLDPTNFNPTGSLNFSVLNNTILRVYLKDDVFNTKDNANIYIFTKSYNILKIISGMGNLIFA